MTTALETTGLAKRYHRTWALRDCTLALPAGRVTALVGPNGAGKSTLIQLAVGLLRPSDGTVRVFGVDPRRGGAPALGRIGYVAQDHPLYARFTVADLLHMGRTLNRRWDDGATRRRLDSLDIPLRQRAGTLSGGQQAQVALALALAKRPDLLILDEPVASLDPLARREFLSVLMDAAVADQLTVLLSSHLVGELERVCDHLILMSRSRVQVAGNVDTLLACHRRLVGPRTDDPGVLPGVAAVIGRSHTDRQTTLIARTDTAMLPPLWEAHPLNLEDLVLAYLAEPQSGLLSGPIGAVDTTGVIR
jgi:ABC-2 type transport system ATP-binding protein